MAGYGYVRARGAYRFNNNGRSARFDKGDVVRADHWAVDENPERFDVVDDHDPAVVAAREAERAALQAKIDSGQVAYESVADQRAKDQAFLFPNLQPSRSGPGARTRDIARRAVESLHRSGDLPDYAAERVEHLLTRSGNLRDQNHAAAWVNTAGDPLYRDAFAKMLAHGAEKGPRLWTAEEQRAYQRVEEFRAMSLTDLAGGELVPVTLDPSILLTSDGTTGGIRALARVVQTATDSWKGVTSAGATAEWLAEATEAADGSPALAQPEVPVHKHSVWVPYSYEVGMDAMNFLSELSAVMTDALAVLQAAAFVSGDGSDKPEGFLTGATQTVASATANVFALGDVYATQEALPPRFQANATWAAPLGTLNGMAQFETTNGAPALPMNDGRLLRKPIAEVSDMTATFTTGGKPLAYGDWRQGYVVADRIGSTVELIPNLMGANRRPTGQRGVFLWARTGGKVVVSEALRVLTIG